MKNFNVYSKKEKPKVDCSTYIRIMDALSGNSVSIIRLVHDRGKNVERGLPKRKYYRYSDFITLK